MIDPYSKETIEAAIKINGREPVHPLGTCFQSALKVFFKTDFEQNKWEDVKLCHGIITTNMPHSVPEKSGHAWIEFTHQGTRYALDVIWMICLEVDIHIEQLRLEYRVEYTRDEVIKNMIDSDENSCWDEKIIAHTSRINPDVIID